jgi:hypothetical protein
LFFCGVFVVVLVSDLFLPPASPSFGPPFELMFGGNVLLTVLAIFLFNIVVSAFVVVSLPGFVGFPLSTVFLLYRAVLWGLLLHSQPTWVLLVALPTLVLEGEAYVLAAGAGTVVGVSWVKPRWVFDEELGRIKAFKKAFAECLKLYVFIVSLLFIAAIIETVTIILVM